MERKSGEEERRKYLRTVGALVAGLAIGGAAAWLSKPVERVVEKVTETVTKTVTATPTPITPTPITPTPITPTPITPTPPAPVTITFICVGGARWEKPARALISDFEKKYPWIKVDVVSGGFTEIQVEKIPMELAARTGAYDALSIDYVYFLTYAANGWLYDIHDWVMSTDPEVGVPDYEKDVPENVRSLYRYKGRYYGVGNDANCQISYIRTDIMEKYGIKIPDDIDTWPKCLEVYKKVHNPPEWYGYTQSWKAPIHAAAAFYQYLWAMGGEVWDPVTFKPLVNCPEARTAFDFILKSFEYAAPGMVYWTDMEVAESFAAGTSAFARSEWGGPMQTSTELNPKYAKLIDATQRVPEWPTPTKKAWPCVTAGFAPVMGGLGTVISADSKHPYEAYLFARYLTLGGDVGKKYVLNTGQPGRISLLTDPECIAYAPYLKGLASNLPYAAIRGGIPEFMEIDTVVGREVSMVLAGEKSAEDAIKTMDTEIYKIFEASGRYKGASEAQIAKYAAKKLLQSARARA